MALLVFTAAQLFSNCGVWASLCGTFSCFRAWTLGCSGFQ